MFKVITGKEALAKVANEEQLFYRLNSSNSWIEVSPFAEWSISDFLESERYVFAIKTEPMRRSYEQDGIGEFAGKRVRITIEEIEQ